MSEDIKTDADCCGGGVHMLGGEGAANQGSLSLSRDKDRLRA